MNAQMDFIETLTKQNVLPLCKFTFFHNKKTPKQNITQLPFPDFCAPPEHVLTSITGVNLLYIVGDVWQYCVPTAEADTLVSAVVVGLDRVWQTYRFITEIICQHYTNEQPVIRPDIKTTQYCGPQPPFVCSSEITSCSYLKILLHLREKITDMLINKTHIS